MKRGLVKRVSLLAAVLLLVFLVQSTFAQTVDVVELVVVSAASAGTTEDGVDYDPYDILVRTTLSEDDTASVSTAYEKWINGEDYGLDAKHTINAIAVLSEYDCASPDCFYGAFLSFKQQLVKVPGISPKVAGQDIVLMGTGIGYFEMAFDGSDVGLSTQSEKIDGLDFYNPSAPESADVVLPDDCTEGVFFISTQGAYRVPAADGGSLTGNGSDILLFCATNLGWNTTGYWFRGHDESDHDLSPSDAMSDFDVVYITSADPAAVDDEAVMMAFSFVTHGTFTGEGGAAGGPSEQFFFPIYGDPWSDYDGPGIDFNQGWPALNGKVTGYDVIWYGASG